MLAQYDTSGPPNQLFITAYAFDDVFTDPIFGATVTAAAATSHSLYLTRAAGNWELYLDGVLLASVPATCNFTETGFQPHVRTDGTNLLYLPKIRYANWAQPPVAIQAATFKGPLP